MAPAPLVSRLSTKQSGDISRLDVCLQSVDEPLVFDVLLANCLVMSAGAVSVVKNRVSTRS